jgi:hypothetical protein
MVIRVLYKALILPKHLHLFLIKVWSPENCGPTVQHVEAKPPKMYPFVSLIRIIFGPLSTIFPIKLYWK